MKKLWFAGFICIVLLSVPAFGEVRLRSDSITLPTPSGVSGAIIGTACIDGYVFAYVWGNGNILNAGGAGVGMTLVQVYEERDGKVVPRKCAQ